MSIRDRLKERLAARPDIQTGFITAPPTVAGRKPQLTTGRNEHGDIMTSTTGVNKSPRRTAYGQAMTAAGRRRGETFQVGRTKDGRTVHVYKDGTRIVLNKRA